MRFLGLMLIGLAGAAIVPAQDSWDDSASVGILGQKIVLPINQTLTPAGRWATLPNSRPVAVALSPDGKWLVTSGKTNLVYAFDLTKPPETPPLLAPLPNEEARASEPNARELQPDSAGQISYTGLVFSPDGQRLYLSNVNGSVKVFQVTPEGPKGVASYPLPKAMAQDREADIPAGLAVSPDGKKIYVCGSLSNNLFELDAADGSLLRAFPTGAVPFQVCVVQNTVWVTNRAGKRPGKGDATEVAGRGTKVKVTGPLSLPGPGSVSVISLANGKLLTEIPVGIQPGAIVVSPDQKHVLVANANADTISVLDVAKRRELHQISVRWKADDPFGASPTGLAFTQNAQGQTQLLACLGTQNAVAVLDFDSAAKLTLRGLVPTAWYPSGVAVDAARGLWHVSCLKGLGSGAHSIANKEKASVRQHLGVVQQISVPDATTLEKHTEQVLANYRVDVVRGALLPARPDQPVRPVPERSGEPSPFEHVVYVIRENRTYDQVFGDIPQGRGRKDLCIFGEEVTPNLHKLAREFVLLDNIYCSGVLSADGHNWALSAFATDYLERSFAGFPRSYPDGLDDADNDVMAWSPQGFLWNAAASAKRTVYVGGEMCHGTDLWVEEGRSGKPSFMDFWKDRADGTKLARYTTRALHESVKPHLATNYPGWSESIADQIRADVFISHLQACERGEKPWENLHILSLPNDHTSGTKPGLPTPAAAVADNDLALGRMIEAVSKSKYWPKTCIISMEDDPQAGWDHVSGFRTLCIVASPYTKRGEVVSTHYNQPGILRTIGLMLGMKPLNQMDAGATPLRDCFIDKPDLTPYTALPNKVPLDQLNPPKTAYQSEKMRDLAEQSEKLPLDTLDACDEDTLNRILWHAMRGPDAEYPLWAVIPKEKRGEEQEEDEEQ
jgi:YVTN family beta-propeller protein